MTPDAAPSDATPDSDGSVPPPCDELLRRCSHRFAYSAVGGESSVELVGNFTADPWLTRLTMTLQGTEWSSDVPIPWGQDTHYKFVINGQLWIADPTNPNQLDDGNGGFLSVVEAPTCDPWTCVVP